MRNLRGTYVHRGDKERRRRRTQRLLLLAGTTVAMVTLYRSREPREANAEPTAPLLSFGTSSEQMQNELEAAKGELDLTKVQLQRMQSVFDYSKRYRIPADLSAAIFDASMAEGLEPELAFRVVNVESEFNERATSPVGAVGLMQVMLPTARYFHKDISRDALYRRDFNLRIGFRYLRVLIKEQKGDLKTALLVYNRGPVAVASAKRQGIDPANGYDRMVLKNYTGKGTID
jgi:soluble lytic murein transglycosylase-like protein